MSVCPLLTVFGLLLGRAATVSTSDILLFLGLGLYLVVLFTGTTTTTEVYAILQNLLEITLLTHILLLAFSNWLTANSQLLIAKY